MTDPKAMTNVSELLRHEVEGGEISSFLRAFFASDQTSFDTNSLYFEKVGDVDMVEVGAICGGCSAVVERETLMELVASAENEYRPTPNFKQNALNPIARRRKGAPKR